MDSKTYIKRRGRNLELRAAKDVLLLLLPLLAIMSYAIHATFIVNEPVPPSVIRLASGQPDSSQDRLAQALVKHLNGKVKVEVIQSSGAVDNLKLLEDGKVDVALTIGGVKSECRSVCHHVRMLGAADYQPLWLFTRKGLSFWDTFDVLNNHSLSINVPGSGTNRIAKAVLDLYFISVEESAHIFEINSKESVQSAVLGTIDAMLLVAGVESESVKAMLSLRSFEPHSFENTAALQARMPYTEKIVIPKGAIDLRAVVPPRDIEMVATTTNLLVLDTLHPVHQYLLLDAVRTLDKNRVELRRPGGFPAYVDRSFPLTDTAERYYEKGLPYLHHTLPLWLAVVFDALWLTIGIMLMLLIPLLKIGYWLSVILAAAKMNVYHNHLVGMLSTSVATYEEDDYRKELDKIKEKVATMRVPATIQSQHFRLRELISKVEARIRGFDGVE